MLCVIGLSLFYYIRADIPNLSSANSERRPKAEISEKFTDSDVPKLSSVYSERKPSMPDWLLAAGRGPRGGTPLSSDPVFLTACLDTRPFISQE